MLQVVALRTTYGQLREGKQRFWSRKRRQIKRLWDLDTWFGTRRSFPSQKRMSLASRFPLWLLGESACLVSRCAIGWRIGEGNVLERRFWPVVGTCLVTAALTRHLTNGLQIKSGLATEPGNATMACGGGGLICPGASNQSPEATDMALAYSEANSSLSGYCSLNSRNNLCARAFCFSRRAARARIILANGRR